MGFKTVVKSMWSWLDQENRAKLTMIGLTVAALSGSGWTVYLDLHTKSG